jgi:hypothetical protein
MDCACVIIVREDVVTENFLSFKTKMVKLSLFVI